MTRTDVTMLVKHSIIRKHRTLSLQICVRQTVRLTTEFVDWCKNVRTLYKHLSVIPAAVTSDLKQRLIDTLAIIWQNVIDEALVNEESDYMQAWGKRTSLWTSVKPKPAFFTADKLHVQPALFRATNSLCGKHVVL